MNQGSQYTGGQPPSFKTNVNRSKTKRWVEAKSYSYDGDDWGDSEDEYEGYDEPAPAPAQPTGLRQAGHTTASRPQPTQQPPQQQLPPTPQQQPPQRQDSEPPQPPLHQYDRTNSFGSLGARSAQSGHSGPTPMRTAYGQFPDQGGPMQQGGPMPPGGRPGYSQQPFYQQPLQNKSGPSAGAQNRGPPPSGYPPQPRPRMSGDGYRPQSMASNNSADSSSHRPPRSGPPDAGPQTRPPRGSSMSQDEPPVVSPPAKPAPQESSAEPEAKPLPFVRPADIYRRMNEERERERLSQDSSRPSTEGASKGQADSPAKAAEPQLAAGPGAANAPKAAAEELKPAPQQEARRSLEVDAQTKKDRRNSPQLPAMAGFGSDFSSDFGDSFFSTMDDKKKAAPAPEPEPEPEPKPEKVEKLAAKEEGDLQHQPSVGYRSVVHQAFDHPALPEGGPSPTTSVVRSNTESTSRVSPIISRGPSEAKEPRPADAGAPQVPTIAEEPNRGTSATSPKEALKNLPEIDSDLPPAGFKHGHRRDMNTPSPDNSPARTPVIERNSRILQAAQEGAVKEGSTRTPSPEKQEAKAKEPQSPTKTSQPNSRAGSPTKGRVRDLAERFSNPSSRRGSQDSARSREGSPTKGSRPSSQHFDSNFRSSIPTGWNSYTTNAPKEEKAPEPKPESPIKAMREGAPVAAAVAATAAAAGGVAAAAHSAGPQAPEAQATDKSNQLAMPAGNRAGESSIMPTPQGMGDGHDLSKDREYFGDAPAPLKTRESMHEALPTVVVAPQQPHRRMTEESGDYNDNSEANDKLHDELMRQMSPEPEVKEQKMLRPASQGETLSSKVYSPDLDKEEEEQPGKGEHVKDEHLKNEHLKDDHNKDEGDIKDNVSEYEGYWENDDRHAVGLGFGHFPPQPKTEESKPAAEVPAPSAPKPEPPAPEPEPSHGKQLTDSKPPPGKTIHRRFSWEDDSEDDEEESSPVQEQAHYQPMQSYQSLQTSQPAQAVQVSQPSKAPQIPQPSQAPQIPQPSQAPQIPPPAQPQPLTTTQDKSASPTSPSFAGPGSDRVSGPTSAGPASATSPTGPAADFSRVSEEHARQQHPSTPPAVQMAEPQPGQPLRIPPPQTEAFQPPKFKQLLAISNPPDRIAAFRKNQDEYHAANTGLDHWIAMTINSQPEHHDLINGASVIPAGQKFANRRVGTAASGTPTQQPYYQQYLSANSTPGAGSSPAGISSAGVSPSSGGKITSQQVQAKGKDFLRTAGKLGGKANVAAKGLFAKGKKQLRSGSEKARAHTSSNSSTPSKPPMAQVLFAGSPSPSPASRLRSESVDKSLPHTPSKLASSSALQPGLKNVAPTPTPAPQVSRGNASLDIARPPSPLTPSEVNVNVKRSSLASDAISRLSSDDKMQSLNITPDPRADGLRRQGSSLKQESKPTPAEDTKPATDEQDTPTAEKRETSTADKTPLEKPKTPTTDVFLMEKRDTPAAALIPGEPAKEAPAQQAEAAKPSGTSTPVQETADSKEPEKAEGSTKSGLNPEKAAVDGNKPPLSASTEISKPGTPKSRRPHSMYSTTSSKRNSLALEPGSGLALSQFSVPPIPPLPPLDVYTPRRGPSLAPAELDRQDSYRSTGENSMATATKHFSFINFDNVSVEPLMLNPISFVKEEEKHDEESDEDKDENSSDEGSILKDKEIESLAAVTHTPSSRRSSHHFEEPSLYNHPAFRDGGSQAPSVPFASPSHTPASPPQPHRTDSYFSSNNRHSFPASRFDAGSPAPENVHGPSPLSQSTSQMPGGPHYDLPLPEADKKRSKRASLLSTFSSKSDKTDKNQPQRPGSSPLRGESRPTAYGGQPAFAGSMGPPPPQPKHHRKGSFDILRRAANAIAHPTAKDRQTPQQLQQSQARERKPRFSSFGQLFNRTKTFEPPNRHLRQNSSPATAMLQTGQQPYQAQTLPNRTAHPFTTNTLPNRQGSGFPAGSELVSVQPGPRSSSMSSQPPPGYQPPPGGYYQPDKKLRPPPDQASAKEGRGFYSTQGQDEITASPASYSFPQRTGNYREAGPGANPWTGKPANPQQANPGGDASATPPPAAPLPATPPRENGKGKPAPNVREDSNERRIPQSLPPLKIAGPRPQKAVQSPPTISAVNRAMQAASSMAPIDRSSANTTPTKTPGSGDAKRGLALHESELRSREGFIGLGISEGEPSTREFPPTGPITKASMGWNDSKSTLGTRNQSRRESIGTPRFEQDDPLAAEPKGKRPVSYSSGNILPPLSAVSPFNPNFVRERASNIPPVPAMPTKAQIEEKEQHRRTASAGATEKTVDAGTDEKIKYSPIDANDKIKVDFDERKGEIFEKDDDEERPVMSSTAYPGQEWRPSSEWDGS